MAEADGIGSDLDRWLEPFLEVLGHKKRRSWAPLYLRGLLGPSERKSLQPMAASLGLSGHDQLQHFIASPAWDDAPLWRVLAEQADRLVGGPEAVLVIDDTALPKKGTLSVGVARQYCGQLGKRANCQALVSLTLAGREVPVPVGLRLFLPEEWTRDPERCAAAGVPDEAAVALTKGEMALAELDRLSAAGVRFGLTLADAGYGASAAFRRGLSERGLTWAVGIPRNQKVYDADVQLVPPTGRKRRPVPDQEPREAEAALADLPWRRVTWRHGTKGPLTAQFAATRIRVGDGKTWANNRHLPGDEVWLVGEWRPSGERKYYLSNLPPRTSLRALAAAIKARWVCEQGHQQLKQGRRHCLRRPRPLRGPILDGFASARADDLHGFRLPAAPSPCRAAPGEVGEKCRLVFRDRHHLRACQPCGAPSWCDCSLSVSHQSAARIADADFDRHQIEYCPGSARQKPRRAGA
jgi:SRSO17 transposase